MEHITINGIERPQVPVKDWGTNLIDLKDKGNTIVTHITEIHHKSDGAVDNGASVAFVCSTRGLQVVCEISLYTLGKALAQLGYQISSVEPTT